MVELISSLLSHAGEFGAVLAPILTAALWKVHAESDKKAADFRAEVRNDVKMLKSNDLSIIRSKLHDKIEIYLGRGVITYDELQTIEDLFDRYTSLGGNSFIAVGMEKIKQLPIKDTTKEDR